MRTFKFNSGNLDELLFEHRNKEYGAYELRTTYHSRVIKSFLATLLLIGFFFGVYVLIQKFVVKEKIVQLDPKEFTFDIKKDFEIQKNEIKPPAIQPPKPPVKNAIADAPFKVLKDSLVQTEIKKDTVVKIIDDAIVALGNGSQGKNSADSSNAPGGAVNDQLIASLQPRSLATVDKAPQFPGGDNSLARYLQKNIQFNERAKSAGVTGRVFASFIINSHGDVEAVKIIHGLGYGLDDEVVRVLNAMPKWDPGYFQGNAVSTILNIPVVFSLVQ